MTLEISCEKLSLFTQNINLKTNHFWQKCTWFFNLYWCTERQTFFKNWRERITKVTSGASIRKNIFEAQRACRIFRNLWLLHLFLVVKINTNLPFCYLFLSRRSLELDFYLFLLSRRHSGSLIFIFNPVIQLHSSYSLQFLSTKRASNQ